jgi:hypothetical protein
MVRILIGLVFVICALAQGPGPGGPMGPGGPGRAHMFGQPGDMRPPEELKDFLGLDDKQVATLEQIAKKAHETMRTDADAMRAKEQQLRDLVEKAADPTAAGKLLFEIEAQRTAMPKIREKAHTDALAVLSEAQKTKLKELRKQIADRAAMRQAVGLNLMYPSMHMMGGERHEGPMMPHGPRRGQGKGFGPGQGPGMPMPERNERPE